MTGEYQATMPPYVALPEAPPGPTGAKVSRRARKIARRAMASHYAYTHRVWGPAPWATRHHHQHEQELKA